MGNYWAAMRDCTDRRRPTIMAELSSYCSAFHLYRPKSSSAARLSQTSSFASLSLSEAPHSSWHFRSRFHVCLFSSWTCLLVGLAAFAAGGSALTENRTASPQSFPFRSLSSLRTLPSFRTSLLQQSSVPSERIIGEVGDVARASTSPVSPPFPYTVSPQVARLTLPFPVSGTCKAGKGYEIRSALELEKLVDEAPCLFAAGEAPVKVPLGLMEGNILTVANNRYLNRLGESGWAGKLASKSQCRDAGSEFYFIQNLALGSLILPGLAYIGDFNDTPGEAGNLTDGKKSLFCDYTVRWEDVCPPKKEYKHKLNLGVLSAPPFANASYDMIRYVGITEDGGYLLLGLSVLRDVFDRSNGIMVGSWWYLVSYDSSAFAGLPAKLEPLERDFRFFQGGVKSMAQRVSPLGNLFNDPVGTTERVIYYNLLHPLGMPPTSLVKEEYEEKPTAGLPTEEKYRLVPFSEPIARPSTKVGRLPDSGGR